MASFNIHVNLAELPVELLYKIFNNLSTVDIYFHVSLVNHRLRAVALSYSNFELITNVPEFRILSNRLSPSQISSLCLSTNIPTLNSISPLHSYLFQYCDIVSKCSLFTFYQDRLDQFDHMRSLDLTGVSNASFLQVINRLIQSMPQLALTLYKIKDGNTDFPAERIENFIRLILTLQNIRHVSLYEPNALLALESAIPTIEHICLESITIKEMQKLKTYRPNLRFFSVKQIKFNESNDKQSVTIPSNNVFVCINHNRMTSKFVELETNLMKKILFVNLHVFLSTLTQLSLQHSAASNQNFDKFFDGSWWEKSLKNIKPSAKIVCI